MNNHTVKKSLLFLLICIVINGSVVVGGGAGLDLPCIQKLLPCQQYLLEPKKVPATCCIPLKEIIADELGCICTVFKNSAIMKALNVTLEQALKLPKACGIKNADTSLCDTATTPSGSPATAPTSPGPKKSAANRKMSYIGGSVVGAVYLALFISFIPLGI